MWNRRHLQPPPECRMSVTLSGDDVDKMVATQAKLISLRPIIIEHMTVLRSEHYILKRMVYKLANQFRRDKALASLRQVKSCINRLIVDIDVKYLLKSLEESLNVDSTKIIPEVYLPSMQTLQYWLVKLIGIAALITKTAYYSTVAFIQTKIYLEHGNFSQHYLVLMAHSARVWYVSRSMRTHICNCYKALLQCLNIFPPTQVPWLIGRMSIQPCCHPDAGVSVEDTERLIFFILIKLPDTEILPKNLNTWLNMKFEMEEKPDVTRDMKVEAEKQSSQLVHIENKEIDEIDLGVPVQRQVFNDGNNNDKTERKICHDSENGKPSQKDRIQSLKKVLKSHIKSKFDVEKFQEDLIKKFLKLGDEKIAISKLGKKKIIKKILLVKQSVTEDEPEDKRDQLFVKKLRPCLARLLVKYDKRTGRSSNIEKLENKKQNNTFDSSDITGLKQKKSKKRKKNNKQADNDTGVNERKAKSQMVPKYCDTNTSNTVKKKNKRKKRK